MKKITFLLCCFFIVTGVYSQQVTKGELFNLFYKAQKEEKAGNKEGAIEIYKTILSLDPLLPTPYLKMANIYAENENDEESVGYAIALYRNYIELQPNDENASLIKNKISELQHLVVNRQDVDVNDIVYIDREQAQEVIITRVRPYLMINTKEELEQYSKQISDLSDKAEQAIEENKIEEGIQHLEQLTQSTDVANPFNAQAYAELIDSYLKKDDWNSMENALDELANNIDAHKNLLEYYGYKIKESVPFEDDICGIWVSDFSSDKNSLPYFAVSIEKRIDGSYEATILPYCSFAKESNMYKGTPFKYTKVASKAEIVSYLSDSYNSNVIKENGIVSFSFGDESFAKGMSATGAGIGIDFVRQVGSGLVDYAASNLNYIPEESHLATGGIELGAALMQQLFVLATTFSKSARIINADIQRIFAGCADLNLIQTKIAVKSSGNEKESVDSLQMKIYKLYPEYDIMFADEDDELFGCQVYSKDEIVNMENYTYCQVLKDKGYFNRQSYKKLSKKISDYCWTKAAENPEMKMMACVIDQSFKYATKGLSYRKFQNKDGYFEGWTNTSGKMTGWGICRFNNGDEYIGNWDNNKYSGNGKFIKKDKDGNFLFEYTGAFKEGVSEGKGMYRNAELTYEGEFYYGEFKGEGKMILITGERYDGQFENGLFKEGVGNYEGGVFDGKWVYIKKDEKKIPVPNGEGTMLTANGEEIKGEWKNGVYQNKEK